MGRTTSKLTPQDGNLSVALAGFRRKFSTLGQNSIAQLKRKSNNINQMTLNNNVVLCENTVLNTWAEVQCVYIYRVTKNQNMKIKQKINKK